MSKNVYIVESDDNLVATGKLDGCCVTFRDPVVIKVDAPMAGVVKMAWELFTDVCSQVGGAGEVLVDPQSFANAVRRIKESMPT